MDTLSLSQCMQVSSHTSYGQSVYTGLCTVNESAVYVYVYVCMCVCVYVYVCVCVCVYVYVYVCVYVCYTCTYTYTLFPIFNLQPTCMLICVLHLLLAPCSILMLRGYVTAAPCVR